ncbi:hypothetical protein EVAR_67033_1 [Eumeta japonica]|uniref:Mariner Mos1 transposase n=1 Tax=Eumeta variegata TaxID=151549 RepID=A0A4C1ZY41_EUMVA|nr:hypothetical protein EVAR_67033_1 [Eumeta japonica]
MVWDIVTGNETWFYCYDFETKQQLNVWVYRDALKPIKVARGKKPLNGCVLFFFNKTGHVATVVLENFRTVNSDWNTIICLPEIIDELRKNYRKGGIILHHDNVSWQTAEKTKFFEKEKRRTYEQSCIQYRPGIL